MEILLVVLIVFMVICIYFLPSIIAFKRSHSYKFPILVINIFAFTGFAWLILLVWSVMPQNDLLN